MPSKRWTGVMFTSFGDESYDERKERVYAIGTVFGTNQEWTALQCAWLKRTCGVPIHAAELESDRGYFESFSHAQNLELYRDLITIIAQSKVGSHSVSMDLRNMKALFPGALKQQSYFWCYNEAMIACAERIKPASMNDLEIVFDRHPENETAASMLYDSMINSDGWKDSNLVPGKLSFDSRDRYVGLQVADVVARETMKPVDNIQQGSPRATRKSIQTLHATERFSIDHLTEEYFMDIKRFIESDTAFQEGMKNYLEWIAANGISDSPAQRFMFARKYRQKQLS